MADHRGFLTQRERELPSYRPVELRLRDWREVQADREPGSPYLTRQAGRCMDCGIPFCHSGCPLGNLIPEWNDLVWRGEWEAASERLHATNNFPEFTGRICPAPCENSCVLGINQPPVTIKNIEVSIIDEAWDRGFVQPVVPERLTGQTVAVVGSGPAGLAAAQQLTRAGHTVVVFEKDDEVGGLLRYGVPDFKLEKAHITRRVDQMVAEGTRFRTGVRVGEDISWPDLRARFDAVVVAIGASLPRGLRVHGDGLPGVVNAMTYLTQANTAVSGREVPDQILATGRHDVIIGGGDTGSDCLGTALRQGAESVTTLAIGYEPPAERPAHEPWPTTPRVLEVSSSHEEGGVREFLASTVEVLGADQVTGVRVAETEYLPDGRRVPKAGTERELPCDLLLIAMGFAGPDANDAAQQLGIEVSQRGPIARDDRFQTTVPGVFVAGDAGRGQSLIVWAIAEGRSVAAEVDRYLMGSTDLPVPVHPEDAGFRV